MLMVETQEEWIAKLKELVVEHGVGVVENWRKERDKHKH